MELALADAPTLNQGDTPHQRVRENGAECPTILENAMAFQAVPETASIEMIFTQNGIPAQNVFYAKQPGGYTLADLQALADAIDLSWDSIWKLRQVAEVLYVRTEVRGLAVINDFVATANVKAGPGTHIGDALPNNATVAIKKESGLTGRSARGRSYWIGLPASELTIADENIVEAAYIANIVSAIDSVRGVTNGTLLWEAVLVSRFTGGVQRPTGVTFPWISSVAVDSKVDTMRGRMSA